MFPDDAVNHFPDLPHLGDVRRNNTDGIVSLRGWKRREKLGDDGANDRRLLTIEEAAALSLADTLRFSEDSLAHLHVHEGVWRHGTLRKHGAEAGKTHTLAVDEHASVDVVVRPRADGGTHAVLHMEREFWKAVAFQSLEERDSVAHAIDGGVLNGSRELVAVSHEDHEGWFHTERNETLGLRALRSLVHDHYGHLSSLVEEGRHLGVGGGDERGHDDTRLHQQLLLELLPEIAVALGVAAVRTVAPEGLDAPLHHRIELVRLEILAIGTLLVVRVSSNASQSNNGRSLVGRRKNQHQLLQERIDSSVGRSRDEHSRELEGTSLSGNTALVARSV